MKKTLVVGASEKPERYSNKAIKMLRTYGHEVVAIGLRSGTVDDVNFDNKQLPFKDIDTITLYIGPEKQAEYQDYLLALEPKRIIFNPGTENYDFYRQAKKHHIEPIEACTLVLLSTGQY